MRGIGLVITGLALSACGGADVSSNVVEDRAPQAGLENDAVSSAPLEPDAASTNDVELAGSVSPCLMQGEDRLEVAPIRAVGTEPFWGVRVEGRCLTYSTPDNQQGVRVWARYSKDAPERATWVGHFEGKPFEMRVQNQENCSDGMSDRRYPLAVELLVDGQKHQGCAEPL